MTECLRIVMDSLFASHRQTYTTTLNERVSNTGRFHTNEGLVTIQEVDDVLSMSKRLSAMTWRQRGMTLKFEPYIIEYNLKEN